MFYILTRRLKRKNLTISTSHLRHFFIYSLCHHLVNRKHNILYLPYMLLFFTVLRQERRLGSFQDLREARNEECCLNAAESIAIFAIPVLLFLTFLVQIGKILANFSLTIQRSLTLQFLHRIFVGVLYSSTSV